MKITLPLFATLISIAQISSALPLWKSKLGPAALAKLLEDRVNPTTPHAINIEARAEADDPAGVAPIEAITPQPAEPEPLVNLISESLASVLKPLEDIATLNGLKLKTTLELEKKKDSADSDVVAGQANSLKGLKFKATVELEQEDESDGSSGVDENEDEVDEDGDDDGVEDLDNDGEDENEPDENEGDTVLDPAVPVASS